MQEGIKKLEEENLNLEKEIKYDFKNKSLLDLALTHGSFGKSENGVNNERLEFLGDAVLELAVSEFLYKKHVDMNEGELSRFRSNIVCEASLASLARKIKLGEYLKLGSGEDTSGGRNKNSILSDALEALFGAIFLDSDFYHARDVIIRLLKSSQEVLSKKTLVDSKSCLQELLQENSTEPVIYKIINESGPAHDRTYVAQVSHAGRILGEGFGKTKKEAEQYAATRAISKLKNYELKK